MHDPAKEKQLLINIKKKLPELKDLLKAVNDDHVYENVVYRYYHRSFKVFHYQPLIKKVLDALKSLSPYDDKHLDHIGEFQDIKNIEKEDKFDGKAVVDAFFHVRYFLEMAVKYGKKLKKPPKILPYGYAALLYLYGLR